MKQVKVNFDYRKEVIPVMVDESLIHLNNILVMLVPTKKLDKKKNIKKWEKAYDFLELSCEQAFQKHTGIDARVIGFAMPFSEEEDPSRLRVQVYDFNKK
jgi:hypothetical protein